MEIWYRLVELVMPFDWAKADHMYFMKNALLAIILVSFIFGILATMIVNNRLAFFSDALGHGAFTGVVIGGMLGFVRPIWSAIVFSIIFSLGITLVKNKSKISSDTVIGVFSAVAVALGIFISTLGGQSFTKLNIFLVGDILSITPSEIGLLFFVLALVVILWWLLFNKLLVVSVNQSLAASRGIKTFWVEVIFTTTIAVIVTISMSWIGLLVINSLLILPAAAARNITSNVRQYHLVTILISMISGVSGLILSYYIETATGATIVLISSIFFFITFALRGKTS
ncbi:MAG TPA: ABC transporter [Clostridiales bacterium]|nr:MAG: ABC transporter [Clostridiales bacterium GWD2_32_19]HCC07754.1 ABC transporter [Clostridiales bacterium]